jgi:hypothetical protein
LRRPSNRLVLPPEARRNIAFVDPVLSIVKNRCASAACHGGSDTPLSLPLAAEAPSRSDLERAYAALTVADPASSAKTESSLRRGKYIDAGRARTSYLIWQLMGTNTARPWDDADRTAKGPSRIITPMPPPGKGDPLTPEELRTLVQWIDLGAAFEAPKPATPPIPSPSHSVR